MTAAETRSAVRAHNESVGEILSLDLQKPSDLVGPVEELFASHQTLRQDFLDRLDDVSSVGNPTSRRFAAGSKMQASTRP